MRKLESAEQEQQGSLPSGWVWAQLRDIAELKGGLTKGQKRKPGDRLRSVPYLRVANVQRGYLELNEVKEIEATEEEIEELRLQKGDLLFNEGGDRDKLGRGWVWQDEVPECIHQNHVFRGRLLSTEIQPKFVSWYSNSIGQRYFLEQGKQTTNLASINLTKLGALPVPIPPPDEQRRIVAEIEKQFSDLDAGVAALKRVQANLKRYRASVLKAACEGRLVPTEAELARAEGREYEPADKLLERILKERETIPRREDSAAPKKTPKIQLPAGWTWATLIQLGELNRGKSKHRPRDDPRLYGGKYPFIQTGEVRHSGGTIREYSKTYSEMGLGQSRLWPSGTLCITIAANIAETGLLTFPACFPDSVVGFLASDTFVSTRFVEFFLRTAKAALEQFAPATAQKNINLEVLEVLAIPLPPLAEQRRIVAEVERRLSVVEQIEAVVNANKVRAERLHQSILKRAFEGKLVPQDPNDEPASVLLDRIRQELASSTSKPSPGQMSLDLEKPRKPRAPRRRSAS